jgi:tetratricopeptide (TPR) repeat protein
VLELDDHFALAVGTLGAVCAQQGRFEEALALSERAHALSPWSNMIVGQLAALLLSAGAVSRAETLLDGLRPGTAWGAPTGMAVFHAMRGEFDRAAEWAARAIDLQYPLLVALLRPLLGSTPVWPALARKMNLP